MPQPDATAPVFDPTSNACLSAHVGPFTEVARFPTSGGGYGLWSKPPYVLEADTTGGLHQLRFDGATFTELDHRTDLGWVEAVVSDGTYFYVGSPGFGLTVFEIGADGTLLQRAQDTTISEARHAWFGNGLVYVPAGGSGLYAVQFDGLTIQHVGTPTPTSGWSEGVFVQRDHIFIADEAAFRILAFDGSMFSDTVPGVTAHTGSTRVWVAGATVFVAEAEGVTAYHFDGTTLTDLDTFAILAGEKVRDVWSDGAHVFLAAQQDGVYALAFDGSHFALVDHVALAGETLGVFGDGTTIFVNGGDGVRAYDGFGCTSF